MTWSVVFIKSELCLNPPCKHFEDKIPTTKFNQKLNGINPILGCFMYKLILFQKGLR